MSKSSKLRHNQALLQQSCSSWYVIMDISFNSGWHIKLSSRTTFMGTASQGLHAQCLMFCGHHLEVLRTFIFKFVFCKCSLMGQWNTCLGIGASARAQSHLPPPLLMGSPLPTTLFSDSQGPTQPPPSLLQPSSGCCPFPAVGTWVWA